MRLLLCAFGLVLVLAATPASAEADRFTASVAHNRLEIEMGDVLDGSDAEAARTAIDDEGNGDGVVQATEVEAYQRAHSHLYGGAPNARCYADFKFVRVNDRVPQRLAEVRTVFVGGEGRVDSTQSFYKATTFVFMFDVPQGDPRVRVEYGQSATVGQSVLCVVGTPDASWASWSPASSIGLPVGLRPGAPEDADAAQGGPAGGAAGETFVVLPLAGYSIESGSIQPPDARRLWDGKGLRADSDEERALLARTPVDFTLRGGPVEEGLNGWVETAAVVGVVGTGGAALGGVALASTEVGRYKVLKLLAAVPLFSRFDKDEVLEHNTREQLYQYIRTNPGPSFSDLRRALELSNGTLVHHLRILEMQEFVKPVRDGFRTRFYVRGPRVVPTAYLTRTQQTILEAILANPGITQKELAQVLGLPRESVFYHARKLETAGKLKVAREGKWRRYFPAENAVPPSPTPVAGVL